LHKLTYTIAGFSVCQYIMSMKNTLLIVILTVSALVISGCASLPELSGLVPADTFIVEESQFIAVNDIDIHFTVAGSDTAADDAADDAEHPVRDV